MVSKLFQMQPVNPYVSTTGVPGWQGVGPMIYTQRTRMEPAKPPAPPSGAAMEAASKLEEHAQTFKKLFEGWSTRLEKFTFDSRTAQGTQSQPSDFEVTLPVNMQQQWCRQIHLGDVQFDGGELFIEREWSRFAFDESFCSDWQNRQMTLQFQDSTVYELWLPQSTTPIKNIVKTGDNQIEVTFGDKVCTSPESLIALWAEFGGTILIAGCPLVASGQILINQNTVKAIQNDGDLAKWTIDFYSYDQMGFLDPLPSVDPSVPYAFGNLLVSNVPSPSTLATVATTLLTGALPYKIVGNVAVPSQGHSRSWKLTLSYNDYTDQSTISYSVAPQVIGQIGFPKLSSSLLSNFGFSQSVDLAATAQAQQYVREQMMSSTVLNSTHVTLNSAQPRPRLVNTGTRIPVGNPPRGCLQTTYNASCALVNWIEDAMNGTWFGRSDEQVDQVPATPFSVTFVDETTNANIVLNIEAGRYTPAELAEQFNRLQTLVTCTVVYGQDHVYQGLRFESRVPSQYFGIRFDTSTIDPMRFGYDRFFYSGQEMYEPVKQAEPYYPNLYFGNSLLRRPTQQHYRATLDPVTNGMRITPIAFNTRTGIIEDINVTTRQIKIRMPIAHGATANAKVVLTNGTVSVTGFVLAPPGLDEDKPGPFVGYTNKQHKFSLIQGFYGSREPLFLTAVVGGDVASLPFSQGDDVKVIFTPPRSWGVDLMPQVAQTIQPSTVGCLPTYMSMTRPVFATLVSPERINPFPVPWVNLQVLLDGDEAGQSMSYSVKESLDAPQQTQFHLVRSIARLLVGNKRSDLTYDSFDRMFPITFMDNFVKVKRIRIRVVRPDGTLYNFHGNPFSVSLVFTMAEQSSQKQK